MLDNIGILNWLDDKNEFVFEPRPRDNAISFDDLARSHAIVEASDNEAPEIDLEYDCD